MPPTLTSLEAAVLATARRLRLFGPADRVLVALSGGGDSTALLAALTALRDAGEIGWLGALHVDHGLRPDSGEDGAAAAETCRVLGVPYAVARVTVLRGNVQAEARRARYAALRVEAARTDATRIATGHNRADQAETVLLRLIRGAGARGLSGIPARRGALVRPLLDRSREELRAYLVDRGLTWREDPTNASGRYARNRLRRDVLPLLARENPAFEAALARAARLARDDERALAALARALLEADGSVRLSALRKAPVAVRRRVVRLLYRAAAGGGRALGAGHVDAVLAVVRGARPRCVDLPHEVVARARYGRLSLGAPAAAPRPVVPIAVPGPGRYELADRRIAVEIAGRPATPATAAFPLLLRARLAGDRFRPLGGRGDRKLKSWLIDRRVPREVRDDLVLLADGGRVLAIPELGSFAEGCAGLEVRVVPLG